MLEIDIKLLPLQGATAPTRDTQGVASLALGYVLLPFQGASILFVVGLPRVSLRLPWAYVLHWAFSSPLLNSKLEAK